MRAALARWPLGAFALLACGIGWAPYLGHALAGVPAEPHNEPLAPLLAAAAVCALTGRGALREWGGRVLSLRAPGWTFALAVAAPIAIALAAVFANHAFGAPLPSAEQWSAWGSLPVSFALFLVVVGFGEEAGWTAFAAPLLLRRHGLAAAWLIAGALRTLWHLPLMLSGDLGWMLGLAGNLAFQFLALWLFRAGGGVWFPVAVWHAVLNTAGGGYFFPMAAGADQERLGDLLAVAYVLAAAAAAVQSALAQRRGAR